MSDEDQRVNPWKQPRPKLAPCPDCRKEISLNAMSCPYCGRKLKQSAVSIVAGLIIILLVVGLIVWFMSVL